MVSSTGTGKTLLSAFDSALKNAGVYNYNLIILSSVIPFGAQVSKQTMVKDAGGQIGDRLYVVKADIRNATPGRIIASGLGWYFLKNGGGVFVEHEEDGITEDSVQSEIHVKIEDSLRDLCEFRGEEFEKEKMGVSVALCKVDKQPACALTLAVYKSEPW